MSAWPETETIAIEAPSRQFGRSASLPLRLAAFFGFMAFASIQYATLIVHPPMPRVLGASAIVTTGAAALASCRRLAGDGRLRALAGALVTVATFLLASVAVGVPAHLLAPGHWGSLGHDLRRGFDGLSGWLWPYRGDQAWARLVVLSVVPLAGTAASAICFWPSENREGVRAAAGLSPLVALFLAGVVNEIAPLWRFQGVVLLVLIFAWFSLPTLRAQDVNRAMRWLLGCTAVALAGAPLLSAARPWIDYTSWNPVAPSTTFQWDQLYGPNTWSRSSATMLEVAEHDPRLLRIATLDRFDGLRFLRSASPPGETRLDVPAGRHPGQWYERATITVTGLRSALLVGAGGIPIKARWLGGTSPPRWREADGTLRTSSPPSGSSRYVVSSYAPAPTPRALRHATRGFPRAYLPYTQFALPGPAASGLHAPNLRAASRARTAPGAVLGAPAPGRSPASVPGVARRIEASPYAGMFALARSLATGAHSSYAVAARIEAFLRRGYAYSLSPPRARYPLEAFLSSDRRGYCQQFSGAMALMLRMDGIPARVAVGFKPGAYDQLTRQWRVRALDAHAWVEVYFAHIGWVSFDPTPPAATPEARLSLQSKAVTPGLRNGSAGRAAGESPASGRLAAPVASRGTSGWWLAVWLAGALALGIAAAWWARARRRLHDGFKRAGAGAVQELLGALRRVGYDAGPGVTLARLEADLRADGLREAARYVSDLRELRYGGAPGRGPTLADRRALRRALGARSMTRRMRALLALPPGAARSAPGALQPVSSAAISSNTAT